MRAYEINGQQWRVDVVMPDGSAAQTVVKASTESQARELAKRYYRGKNLRVRVVAVAPEPLNEINAEDELSVSQQIQDYFTKRGYKYLGEGRDQIAFESPRGTVVKVLGIGDDEREQVVRDYVAYFVANQKNPYYPRIYNTGEFTLDGETYFVYEMEYLQYVANEERTLDFLETLMWKLSTGDVQDFLDKNLIPSELSDEEVYGLIETTENLLKYLGKKINAPLDLHNVENLRRRANGHLVITDPFSL